MKTLFLIDGAAGTGKSDLARYLATRKRRTVAFIAKYTTRPARKEEQESQRDTDLRFPPDSHDQFMERTKDSSFYWYTYGNRETGEYFYGFYRSDIENALADRDVAVVIARDFETIKQVKADFTHVRCISAFVYTDRNLVVQRLKTDGYSGEEIEFRLSRQPLAWADYVKNSTSYDEKIINSSDRKDFFILIDALLAKASHSPRDVLRVSPGEEFRLVRPLIGFKPEMDERLRRLPYNGNIFLMMRFRARNQRVHKFIERTLDANGFRCVRADDPAWDITRNTYNPIAALYCCKYGIALFDEAEEEDEYSPNVAYELGMMHEQGKECLILRHKSLANPPFDLVKELYVDYKDSLELEEIIETWVKKIAR